MTDNGRKTGPRCIAIVGPFASGKTSLLEEILARTGTIEKPGTVGNGTTVGNSSAEARAHSMSVELNVAETNFMGDSYTFLDCPGSVEFNYESEPAVAAIDAAIVVAEPDEKKMPALQVVLRGLNERGIPHFLFLNKIDKATIGVGDALAMLQPASDVPLVLDRSPSSRMGRRPASSTSRSTAPSFTASTRRARWSPSTTTSARGATKRGSPCWSASPTTTTP